LHTCGRACSLARSMARPKHYQTLFPGCLLEPRLDSLFQIRSGDHS
jgi:hypothetical protein